MTTQWGWPGRSRSASTSSVCACCWAPRIGFFDLRMLGVARAVPLRSLHRLIPFGIAGFAICAITGTLFVMTTPDQYLHNPAFLTKLLLMLVAGLNMLLFYLVAARSVWLAAADGVPPLPARLFRARVVTVLVGRDDLWSGHHRIPATRVLLVSVVLRVLSAPRRPDASLFSAAA